MAFSQLTGGQRAALILLVSAAASENLPHQIKNLIAEKDWHRLHILLSVTTAEENGAVPSEDDLRHVGALATGIRNANFLLALLDANSSDAARPHFESALQTHCYDRIAERIHEKMTDKSLEFSGEDLRDAVAPDDRELCNDPDKAEGAIVGMMAGGTPFSSKLSDLFTNDLSSLVSTGDPDPFSPFYASLENLLKNGLPDFNVRTDFDMPPPFRPTLPDPSRW